MSAVDLGKTALLGNDVIVLREQRIILASRERRCRLSGKGVVSPDELLRTLKRYLAESGDTEEAIASRIGVNHHTLRRWLSDKQSPKKVSWRWLRHFSGTQDTCRRGARNSMVRTEHRLEAYATLLSGLSSDLSEPSWELSPWTRVTTQRPKVAWLPACVLSAISESRYRRRGHIRKWALNPLGVVSGKTEVENHAGTANPLAWPW